MPNPSNFARLVPSRQYDVLNLLAEAAERCTSAGDRTAGLTKTAIDGLSFVRAQSPGVIGHSLRRPLICLVLQGAKKMTIATTQVYAGNGDSTALTNIEPVVSHVVQASRTTPYLAMTLPLDLELLAALRLDMLTLDTGSKDSIGATNGQVLATALRLVQILDHPASLPMLQGSLLRELHYWLLGGRHGPALSCLIPSCSRQQGVRRAVDLIRAAPDAAIDIARLADAACMGTSTFRRHFRAATGLTPLQFQKQLRLRTARRLMLYEGAAAAPAAFAVGYRSASQFTREYHRLFGIPPTRDVKAARRRNA